MESYIHPFVNPFRVRCALQILEPFSIVFVTGQTLRKLPFSVFWATHSTEKKRFTRSDPKYRTLDAIHKPFCCKLASVDRELRRISLDCLILVVHRTSIVVAPELSFVHHTDDLIFLSTIQNAQNIVDD